MTDIIHVIKPGRVEGNKLRLGEVELVPVDPDNPDGPKRTAINMSRICLKLGNGLTAVGETNGMVALEVTAEAAKRLGWAHPANEAAAPVNLDKLRAIVGNQAFGQQEQRDALRQIRAIDPELGEALARANAWLEAA
jgi:hypothetical protein